MKKLAKVVLMLAVAVLTALGLFACTDTGEDPNNGENPGGGCLFVACHHGRVG